VFTQLVKRSLHVVFLVIVLLLTSELVVFDDLNRVLGIVNILSHKCDNKYSQSGVIQYYELKSVQRTDLNVSLQKKHKNDQL